MMRVDHEGIPKLIQRIETAGFNQYRVELFNGESFFVVADLFEEVTEADIYNWTDYDWIKVEEVVEEEVLAILKPAKN